MIRKFIKQIPFLNDAGLYLKHNIWQRATSKSFKSYITSNSDAKLQLGSGSNTIPGWFNTDYFPRTDISFLNVVKKFPFNDNTFEFVFSEHHIEHITYKQACFMLTEVFRVLKPGGYIKIITPDVKKYAKAYSEDLLDTELVKKHMDSWVYSGFHEAQNYIPVDNYYKAHFINDIFLNYLHRFIYDEHALKSILEQAGFHNCTTLDRESPGHLAFKGINSHTTEFDGMFSLYMIAQKPLN